MTIKTIQVGPIMTNCYLLCDEAAGRCALIDPGDDAARVEKLVRPAAKLSELEKEQYVHDFICENVHYDKLKKPYSHEIIGPLGHGVGVCEGIAKSVKVLCDALGS